MFTIGESHAISHVNGTEQQTQQRRIQQPAVNPRRGRFDTETESSGARTPSRKFNASNEKGDGSNKQRSRENITR